MDKKIQISGIKGVYLIQSNRVFLAAGDGNQMKISSVVFCVCSLGRRLDNTRVITLSCGTKTNFGG